MAKRTHSTIDYLPEAIQDTMTRMVTDGYWPDELGDDCEGKPTYDDIVQFVIMNGHTISRSAVGRWAKKLLVYERMNLSRDIARQVMSGIEDDSTATEVQKAAAEIMTAQIIDVITTGELAPKDISMISGAIRDCTQVALKADQYIRKQIEAKVKTAAANVEKKLEKNGTDRKQIQEIVDEFLGITK